MGFSATYDKDSSLEVLAPALKISHTELSEISKTRFGGDLSFNIADFSFESEVIRVHLEKTTPHLEQGLNFFYATLGYNLTESFFMYGSYWIVDGHQERPVLPDNRVVEDEIIKVSTIGASYNPMDRVRFKAQFARITVGDEFLELPQGVLAETETGLNLFGVAVSVFF